MEDVLARRLDELKMRCQLLEKYIASGCKGCELLKEFMLDVITSIEALKIQSRIYQLDYIEDECEDLMKEINKFREKIYGTKETG